MRHHALLATALLLTAGACTDLQPEVDAEYRSRVVDAVTGAPIQGATVALSSGLLSNCWGDCSFSGVTDKDGWATVRYRDDIDGYSLRVTHPRTYAVSGPVPLPGAPARVSPAYSEVSGGFRPSELPVEHELVPHGAFTVELSRALRAREHITVTAGNQVTGNIRLFQYTDPATSVLGDELVAGPTDLLVARNQDGTFQERWTVTVAVEHAEATSYVLDIGP